MVFQHATELLHEFNKVVVLAVQASSSDAATGDCGSGGVWIGGLLYVLRGYQVFEGEEFVGGGLRMRGVLEPGV